MGYGDFWCRRCEIAHSGECKPVIVKAAAGLHDWEDQPVVDLSNVSVCRACGLRHRVSLIDLLTGPARSRPVDGCPKKSV